jgi:hypothetical protein
VAVDVGEIRFHEIRLAALNVDVQQVDRLAAGKVSQWPSVQHLVATGAAGLTDLSFGSINMGAEPQIAPELATTGNSAFDRFGAAGCRRPGLCRLGEMPVSRDNKAPLNQ